MKITRKEFFNRNHYTHIMWLCAALFIWCIIMGFVSEPSYFIGSGSMAVVFGVVLWQGRKAYNRYASSIR